MIINQTVSGGSSPAPADPMSLKLRVSNGKLQHNNTSTVSTTIDFTGVTEIDDYVLAYAYYGNTTITGSAFRNGQITLVGNYGAYNTYNGCTGITSTGLDNIQNVYESGLQYCFAGCTGITSVDLSNLMFVGTNGMFGTFYNCSNLTGNIEIGADSLEAGCFASAFAGTSINSLSFPNLQSIVWDDDGVSYHPLADIVDGCTDVVIHFPVDMEFEPLIADYVSSFGGTNTTVLFDLGGEPEEPEEPEEEL